LVHFTFRFSFHYLFTFTVSFAFPLVYVPTVRLRFVVCVPRSTCSTDRSVTLVRSFGLVALRVVPRSGSVRLFGWLSLVVCCSLYVGLPFVVTLLRLRCSHVSRCNLYGSVVPAPVYV